ncbi:MAG: type II toxin-antitoxin system HicB family antitoxin [Candidatus Nitrosotenuis sp.]
MKKNKLTFSVKEDEEGGYTAQCVEFPGIITEADTKRELRIMINDAVEGYFEAFPDEKEKLPSIKKSEVIVITV